ncbi:helix-turn-helix transcriptional regulator [Sinimarinibacterium sp. CAU 1509]|nr:helix-turn-helix transcriptional regulator [Sinimarinibacterium sp. CAU 1509]
MIRCHLSRMMGERKLRVIDVSRMTGIHRNMVTLLYRETATRVDIDALDRLCRLFNCTVGDLLEFVNEPDQN